MDTPKVVGYEVGENAVTIRYEDGHSAVWVPPTGGWGIPNTIAQIHLLKDRAIVATYNSPYQTPRTTSPDGFAKAVYPVERIIAYWQAGYDYLATAYRTAFDGRGPSDKLRSAWPIISHSRQDLKDLHDGRWPSPPRP